MQVNRMENTLRTLFILLIMLFISAQSFAGDEKDGEKEAVKISYVDMGHSFVSNLTGGPKYIRCDIQLMTKYASNVDIIKLHMPALRHTILMLLAGADGKKLLTPEGKEALRKQALEAVRKKLEELTDQPRVKDLYFTAYYVK